MKHSAFARTNEIVALAETAKRLAKAAKRFHVSDLRPGYSAEQVADALVRAAGTMEIAATRVW